MVKLLWNRFLLWKLLRDLESLERFLQDEKTARLKRMGIKA